MNPVAAGKQLHNLFPGLDPSTRIAVVGGGPSGLSAALALTRLGYKNVTLLEQDATVGGMCRSELIEGRVYDLGGQVIARESSPTLDTLMAEMGMELEPLGEQPFSQLDFDSGNLRDLKIAADVLSMIKITEKLEKSLIEVPEAVAALFTASGYGYPEHIPYAYMHEFVYSCLGQAWRVKGGYDRFWRKVADQIPEVRCSTKVKAIKRDQNEIQISVVDSNSSAPSEQLLKFDKLIVSGSACIPRNSRIYLSNASDAPSPGEVKDRGILDYTAKEMELFSKVVIVDYYTTVLKISGFEHFPPRFYYPDFARSHSSVGRFVVMQRFHADTNVFLFWSYGTKEIDQNQVTQHLFRDVERMGGRVEALVVQRKFRYFPHVTSTDMAEGFYDKLEELQGENNTYFVGALMAFELTERNASYSINLMAKYFGSTVEAIYVKRLIEYPLPNGAGEPKNFNLRELTELPGFEFPDLPSIDHYLSFYAEHPVTKDKVVYTWVDEQGKEINKLTFSQLDASVTTIASYLLTCELNLIPGDRIILLHPPGLEFIEAFLACLRAKILAVPLIPPDASKRGGDLALEKLRNVAKITEAKAILTTRAYHSAVRTCSLTMMGRGPKWPDLPWIESNCLSAVQSTVSTLLRTSLSIKTIIRSNSAEESEKRKGPLHSPPDPDSICFLQFTSGSTGESKGVMISHGALVHNTKSMRSAYRFTTRMVGVSWLPQYHDMGLIGSFLAGLVCGGHIVKFSPITFIRKPLMWLSLIEKYRVTHTAAPNFGFELVLKRYEALKAIGKEPKLDLSSLNFLMVGAEPINSRTVKEFVEIFWDAGVREQIFAPGFGLAENCVFICCAHGRNEPVRVDSQGRVSCGYIRSGEPQHKDICADVRIVNPLTLEEVREGVEGEIWISSPSNGKGYWGLEELTRETFCAQLNRASPDDSQKRFVRSGDLGRNIQGNLFVTGRIKDLIIVGGRNHYPSDIEKTVENCSNLIKPGCSAAFSIAANVLRSKGIEVADESEGIVVVVEVRDESQAQPDLVLKVKSSVAEVHGLQVSFVNLIKPRTIPKTTSGKIRRKECAKRFVEGTLESLRMTKLSRAQARLRRDQNAPYNASHKQHHSQHRNHKGRKEISDFLVSLVAELSGLPVSKIDMSESFENFSIDSHGAVSTAFKLSEFIGTQVSAIQIYTTGCISELADLAIELMSKSKVAESVSVLTDGRVNHILTEKMTLSRPHGTVSQRTEEELSEAELADALEPSLKRMFYITALQILGIWYISFMLFSPAVYIYKNLIQAVSSTITSGNQVVLLTAILVPSAWLMYIASVGLLLSTFGLRLLLPVNFRSQTRTIPLWSAEYVRWWTLYRLQDFASTAIASELRGTIFLTFWYRLLGAEIEDGVHLDTTDITDPWLMSIGKDSVVAEGVTIQSHQVNAGVVRFGGIRVGSFCSVGPYSILQNGCVLERGSSVPVLGKVEIGEYVESKQTMTKMSSKGSIFTFTHTIEIALKQLFGLFFLALLSTLAAQAAYLVLKAAGSYFEILGYEWNEVFKRESSNHGSLLLALVLTFPRYLMIVAPLMVFPTEPRMFFEFLKYLVTSEGKFIAVLTVFGAAYMTYGVMLTALTCTLKWSIVGKVREGTSSQFSCRLWLVHTVLRFTHDRFVFLLRGTEAFCIYLRMLGADIGRCVSIRKTNALIDPDLIKLGDGCHLGDFCKIITTENYPGGSFSSAKLIIGNQCVVGAQSVVMPGSTFKDRTVLGALSVASKGMTLETDGVYVGAPQAVRVKGSLTAQTKKENKVSIKMGAEIGTPESILSFNQDPLDFKIDPRFRQIIASCAGEFARKTPKGHHRYIHHLGGSGKGVLRVLENASNLPLHDIFKPGSMYPMVLRFSTGISKDDDRGADVRGAMMRLLHPESPDDMENPLLDLSMKTGEIFHVQNMVDFTGYYIMSEEERALKIKQFPILGEAQWLNIRRPKSFADLHYYCCTCRYFVASSSKGTPEVFYVKFKLRPSDLSKGDDQENFQRDGDMPPFSGALPTLPDDARPKTCLRDDLKQRLESPEGVKYMLQMQLHPVPASLEEQEQAQDPSKVWDEKAYPLLDVAEVWLTEHVDDAIFDKLRFNPRFGPPSLAMITATSATQSASVDTGRSIIHELLTYIRSGRKLPPPWYDLLKKSHADVLTSSADTVSSGHVNGSGCPFSPGGAVTESNKLENPLELENDTLKQLQAVGETKTTKALFHNEDTGQMSVELKLLGLLQPVLQIQLPVVISLLVTYPCLLGLSWVSSKVGVNWMFTLIPLGFIGWGLLFATVTIVCKWVGIWRIKDGSKNNLWSHQTSLHTVWDCINHTLGSSFLELGKGSVLITLYLRYLGASISSAGVYIDTLFALNPDQVRIGYRSAIDRAALLFGHIYEGQKVEFKSIIVKDDSFVGSRALLLPGFTIEDGAELSALSLGMKDEIIRPTYN
ncbi:hypothetical protein R1flu_009340 [Riccia fluitans]|uniref:Carrier domain-containing protein n=1 Tax=Riccia fluitans TaxID=41844 RepID=A0ABD1Z1Y8_9MARC